MTTEGIKPSGWKHVTAAELLTVHTVEVEKDGEKSIFYEINEDSNDGSVTRLTQKQYEKYLKHFDMQDPLKKTFIRGVNYMDDESMEAQLSADKAEDASQEEKTANTLKMPQHKRGRFSKEQWKEIANASKQYQANEAEAKKAATQQQANAAEQKPAEEVKITEEGRKAFRAAYGLDKAGEEPKSHFSKAPESFFEEYINIQKNNKEAELAQLKKTSKRLANAKLVRKANEEAAKKADTADTAKTKDAAPQQLATQAAAAGQKIELKSEKMKELLQNPVKPEKTTGDYILEGIATAAEAVHTVNDYTGLNAISESLDRKDERASILTQESTGLEYLTATGGNWLAQPNDIVSYLGEKLTDNVLDYPEKWIDMTEVDEVKTSGDKAQKAANGLLKAIGAPVKATSGAVKLVGGTLDVVSSYEKMEDHTNEVITERTQKAMKQFGENIADLTIENINDNKTVLALTTRWGITEADFSLMTPEQVREVIKQEFDVVKANDDKTYALAKKAPITVDVTAKDKDGNDVKKTLTINPVAPEVVLRTANTLKAKALAKKNSEAMVYQREEGIDKLNIGQEQVLDSVPDVVGAVPAAVELLEAGIEAGADAIKIDRDKIESDAGKYGTDVLNGLGANGVGKVLTGTTNLAGGIGNSAKGVVQGALGLVSWMWDDGKMLEKAGASFSEAGSDFVNSGADLLEGTGNVVTLGHVEVLSDHKPEVKETVKVEKIAKEQKKAASRTEFKQKKETEFLKTYAETRKAIDEAEEAYIKQTEEKKNNPQAAAVAKVKMADINAQALLAETTANEADALRLARRQEHANLAHGEDFWNNRFKTYSNNENKAGERGGWANTLSAGYGFVMDIPNDLLVQPVTSWNEIAASVPCPLTGALVAARRAIKKGVTSAEQISNNSYNEALKQAGYENLGGTLFNATLTGADIAIAYAVNPNCLIHQWKGTDEHTTDITEGFHESSEKAVVAPTPRPTPTPDPVCPIETPDIPLPVDPDPVPGACDALGTVPTLVGELVDGGSVVTESAAAAVAEAAKLAAGL